MNPDQHIRTRLKDKVVGIAGCGGLGSNCAVALARVGMGKLIIADFDTIEASNLNRQCFFKDQLGQNKAFALKDIIGRIDEKVYVEAHDLFLTETNITELFSECDVIVEAFDKAEMKMMIIETVIEKMPEKPLVCGVGLAGWGSNEAIGLKKYDNIYICGDRELETSAQFPPLAPRVGMVANMQANVVLEILLGKMK
jgi:sulfur carrier protein ThiS adenylyltransferase